MFRRGADWLPLGHTEEQSVGYINLDDPRLVAGLDPDVTLEVNANAIRQTVFGLGGYRNFKAVGHSLAPPDVIDLNANDVVHFDPKKQWQAIRQPALNSSDQRNGTVTVSCASALKPGHTDPHDRAVHLDGEMTTALIDAIYFHNTRAVREDRRPATNFVNRTNDYVLGVSSGLLVFGSPWLKDIPEAMLAGAFGGAIAGVDRLIHSDMVNNIHREEVLRSPFLTTRRTRAVLAAARLLTQTQMIRVRPDEER